MKKIITVIGARPQIIKSAALNHAIKTKYSNDLEEVVVHTGQHYDSNMSAIFFNELGLSAPAYNLNVGAQNPGIQTAAMISGLEEILLKEKPDIVVVYGDTNSTLATAVAASKLHLPIAHIEAGLRSFNKSMPEEINRIFCDHASTLLFSPTPTGIKNLEREGFLFKHNEAISIDNPKVYHCGDVMYDNSLYYAHQSSNHLPEELKNRAFILATVHRPSNTDHPQNLKQIFDGFLALLEEHKELVIALPLHPRTKKAIKRYLPKKIQEIIEQHPRFLILPPASYLRMIALEKNCQLVITDSGGVQKEAYFFKKACIILRKETEWVEIVKQGAAKLVGADKDEIVSSTSSFLQKQPEEYPPLFGDGKAGLFIAQELLNFLNP